MADAFNRNVKFLLLLCVIAVVAASGCVTGGGDIGGGPGIVVEKFEPALTSVESGETVALQLEVRNEGDYNGGLGGSGAHAISQIMSIDPFEWQVLPSTIYDMGTILAPIRESQTPGELKKATWQLTAPLLERGQTKTYEILARTFYEYETKAIKPVWFVTGEELRKAVQNGETLASESVTQTSGPLTVDVITGNFVKSNDYRSSRFQLQIKIRNTGGGTIRGTSYPVAIHVDYPAWVMPVEGTCPSEWQTVTPEDYREVPVGLMWPDFGNFVYVWDGQQTDVTCEFQIIQPPASRTKGDFEIRLGYIYSVDAKTQLTVEGMEEF